MGFEWLGKHGHVSRQGTCGGWCLMERVFIYFTNYIPLKLNKNKIKCPSMKIFGLFPSNLMNCP